MINQRRLQERLCAFLAKKMKVRLVNSVGRMRFETLEEWIQKNSGIDIHAVDSSRFGPFYREAKNLWRNLIERGNAKKAPKARIAHRAVRDVLDKLNKPTKSNSVFAVSGGLPSLGKRAR